FFIFRPPPTSTLFPYTTLFRSYVNNDVPQFRATGLAVEAVPIGDVPLVGIGLGTTSRMTQHQGAALVGVVAAVGRAVADIAADRSEEHTSELQSRENLVCRLLL